MVGFFAKQMVLSAAIDKGYIFLSLIAILTSVIGAVYYLNVIKEIYFYSSDYKINPLFKNSKLNGDIINRNNNIIKSITFNYKNITMSSSVSITISIITLVVLLFMFLCSEWLSMGEFSLNHSSIPLTSLFFVFSVWSTLICFQGRQLTDSIFIFSVYIPFILNKSLFHQKNKKGRGHGHSFSAYIRRRLVGLRKSLYNYNWMPRNPLSISSKQVRHMSNETLSKDKFLQWFTGLTDGEGLFLISFINKGYYAFKFEIGLHLDDKNMLDFIHKELGIGKVWTKDNKVFFTVTRQKEITSLIEIFTNYPIFFFKKNIGLNFLDFKKAFELYTSSNLTEEIFSQIESIKKNMNSLRTNYDMRDYYKKNGLIISAYWFLGFLEGEGSFFVTNRGGHNITMEFSLTQSYVDLILMEAIKEFLNNLADLSGSNIGNLSFAYLYVDNKERHNLTDIIIVKVTQGGYIKKVLIPFLDSLKWQSKKVKDYQDWKILFQLKEKGLHYLPDGLKVMKDIIDQMNRRRLSSNEKAEGKLGRVSLDKEINRLLSGPSNLVVMDDGRVLIKSLNKYYSPRLSIKVEILDVNSNVLKTFPSIKDCAEFLGVTRQVLTRRILSRNSILLDSEQVWVRKIEEEE